MNTCIYDGFGRGVHNVKNVADVSAFCLVVTGIRENLKLICMSWSQVKVKVMFCRVQGH